MCEDSVVYVEYVQVFYVVAVVEILDVQLVRRVAEHHLERVDPQPSHDHWLLRYLSALTRHLQRYLFLVALDLFLLALEVDVKEGLEEAERALVQHEFEGLQLGAEAHLVVPCELVLCCKDLHLVVKEVRVGHLHKLTHKRAFATHSLLECDLLHRERVAVEGDGLIGSGVPQHVVTGYYVRESAAKVKAPVGFANALLLSLLLLLQLLGGFQRRLLPGGKRAPLGLLRFFGMALLGHVVFLEDIDRLRDAVRLAQSEEQSRIQRLIKACLERLELFP